MCAIGAVIGRLTGAANASKLFHFEVKALKARLVDGVVFAIKVKAGVAA
jgi:hypothetical protein